MREQAQARLFDLLYQYLGRGGELSQHLRGYEYRPEQIKMAQAVLENLINGGILLVEAGTGTGKTLAYLVPAILSARRVVISTGTKNLQEQIFYKDLPLLAKHFEFSAVVMKGRRNYLCWRRFYRFLAQPRFDFASGQAVLELIQNWAQTTETGDKEELKELSEDEPIWDKICSDSELCLASNCPHFSECFISKLRARAQKADLIIVNHHLFFADLAIRQLGFGEVIPRYRAVVFDEAHILEDVITDYFGIQLSDRKIIELARDLNFESQDLEPFAQKELSRLAQKIESLSASLFKSLRELFMQKINEEEKRMPFNIDELPFAVFNQAKKLKDELFGVAKILNSQASDPSILAMALRAEKQAQDLDFLFRQDEKDYVYYAQLKPRATILCASPLEVGSLLQKVLYPHLDSLIFTSATLTVFNEDKPSFEYFRSRMGLSESPHIKELWLESSFDWKNQALLFLAPKLPEPDSPQFVEQAVELVKKLLDLSKGRAFLLFTSYKNLEQFYERLAPHIPYLSLRQGDAPRSHLLEKFREIESSVLFATISFWQGVDVVGPALSLVVIDRLPFDSPSDPLIKARINAINSRGGNAFMDYQVPSAVIMLRQGIGRLIRSRSDKGVLAILDSRVLKRNYGRIFLQSLPQIPITQDIKRVEEFFQKLNSR